MHVQTIFIPTHEVQAIYTAFLAGDTAQAMLAAASLPQVFLDHIVGYYLPGGEEDLNDPQLFARVMHFREALIAASSGDLSKLPRLSFVRPQVDVPGYDATVDVIRLNRSMDLDLKPYVGQIEGVLPTVLISRKI